MIVVAWIVLMGVVMVGLALAVLSGSRARRSGGRLVAVAAIAGLLLLQGADLLALGWLLLALPVAARPVTNASPPGGRGRLLAGGVVAAVLFAAFYLVIQRTIWHGLPAGAFHAQTAGVGGRLLTGDAVFLVGLLLGLAVVLAAAGRGRHRTGDREETP